MRIKRGKQYYTCSMALGIIAHRSNSTSGNSGYDYYRQEPWILVWLLPFSAK